MVKAWPWGAAVLAGSVLIGAEVQAQDQPVKPAPDSTGPQMMVPDRKSGPAKTGVVVPPAQVDPGMPVAAPDKGSIKVIHPPGTAGGNPDVVPK